MMSVYKLAVTFEIKCIFSDDFCILQDQRNNEIVGVGRVQSAIHIRSSVFS